MSTFPLLVGIMGLGTPEMIGLLILGIILFGRRLPEVGRSLGKGIVEFKKGLSGLEDEVASSIRQSEQTPVATPVRPPQRVATSAPKFEDNSTNAQPSV